MASENKGRLFLCPTPIGNLEDITLRVLRVLGEAHLIAAEDTRHTRKLLNHYSIQTPLTSYREHNRARQGEILLAKMAGGFDVALVRDAGMPGISDPGHELVQKALEAGFPVEVLPGPSASLTGLLSSGYPPVPFTFWGFLPPRGKKRREALERLKEGAGHTMVLYEAPHRLVRTLEDLKEQGFEEGALCRELTKKFQEVRRGTLEEHLENSISREPRGEYVIVLPARKEPEGEQGEVGGAKEEVAALMAGGITKKEAIAAVAQRRGLPRKEIYRQCYGLSGRKAKKNSTQG